MKNKQCATLTYLLCIYHGCMGNTFYETVHINSNLLLQTIVYKWETIKTIEKLTYNSLLIITKLTLVNVIHVPK